MEIRIDRADEFVPGGIRLSHRINCSTLHGLFDLLYLRSREELCRTALSDNVRYVGEDVEVLFQEAASQVES